jgi:acyl carrier protein
MTPSRDEIAAVVREIFQKTLKRDPSQLQDATRLKEDLKVDSLDMIEVVYEVEDRFDVQIPEERLKQIQTFGQIVDGLRAALEAKGTAGG